MSVQDTPHAPAFDGWPPENHQKVGQGLENVPKLVLTEPRPLPGFKVVALNWLRQDPGGNLAGMFFRNRSHIMLVRAQRQYVIALATFYLLQFCVVISLHLSRMNKNYKKKIEQ